MITVLFVCIENSCRSQMAEGFAKRFGQNIIESYSAGSKPSGKINLDAVKVMLEDGIDISQQASKGFKDIPVKKIDFVITLGCKDSCPLVNASKHVEWDIEDPKGRGIEQFRAARDDIKQKVLTFINEISNTN